MWFFLCFLFVSHSVEAARIGSADIRVNVYASPRKDSKVIAVLNPGTEVRASNFEMEGFYKIRFGDHQIGFVPSDSLQLEDIPTPEELHSASLAEEDEFATEKKVKQMNKKRKDPAWKNSSAW